MRLLVAILALGLACERSEPESNREKEAEVEQKEAPAALEFVSLTDPGPPPAGIDASLWSDVGWFPASTVGITPMREQLHFVDWLRDKMEAFGVQCTSVIDGIDRYYMVDHHDSPGQTLVLYGTLDRMRIDDCARSTFAKIPSTGPRTPVVTEGAVTRIGEAENAHFIGWLERGDEVVAIYDKSRKHVETMLAGGDTLASNTAMIELLRDAPEGALTSMSLEDFGSIFLQVPSVGYSFGISLSKPLEVRVRVYFPDELSASRASAETDALIDEFEAAGLSVGLVNDGVEGSRLRLRLTMDFFENDPKTTLGPILEVLSKRRVAAGLEPIDVNDILALAGQATG